MRCAVIVLWLAALSAAYDPYDYNYYRSPKPEAPTPQQPTPEEPTPVVPQPNPEASTPEEPTPEATPQQPTPQEPTPEQPTPEQPIPVDEPNPEAPPEEPRPEQPTPVDEPTPEAPMPAEPTPEKPIPVDEPTPEAPVPEQPTPDQPTPEEPNPNEWETTVYLPQVIRWTESIRLLESQGQGSYMVTLGGNDFDAVGAGRISFRNSKNWADKSEHLVPHGETLQGQDEGDGWVSFRILVRRQWVDEPAEEQPAEKPKDPRAEEQPAEVPAADGPDGWKVLSCSSSTFDRTSGKWVCLPDPETTTTTTTTPAPVNSKALKWDPISGKWIKPGEPAQSEAAEPAAEGEGVARGEWVVDSRAPEGVKYLREEAPAVNAKALKWDAMSRRWIKQGEPDNSNAAQDAGVARGEWVIDGTTYKYEGDDRYVRQKLSDIVR